MAEEGTMGEVPRAPIWRRGHPVQRYLEQIIPQTRRVREIHIPTDSRQRTLYRNSTEAYITNRDIWAYRGTAFSDEYTSIEEGMASRTNGGDPIVIRRRESPSEVVAGGEKGALGAGRVVLDLGSGHAAALLQLAQEYPRTTFIGADVGYYVNPYRPDLRKKGVQLIGDSWRTLPSIPDGSVDTILSVCGALTWGIMPLNPDDTGRLFDTITRVCKPGAILRFDAPTEDRLAQNESYQITVAELQKRGWNIHHVNTTCIATKN